jgi:hypothetical protein
MRSARCCARAVCAISVSIPRCLPTALPSSIAPASSPAPARHSSPARSSAPSGSGLNSTTQMDLQGQAASESAGHRHRRAVAVRARRRRLQRRQVVHLHVVQPRAPRRTRQPHRPRPDPWQRRNHHTRGHADMMSVVTEYGIVNLKGKSIPERARAMISIAHPDFRDDLDRDARAHGLIPRGVSSQGRARCRWHLVFDCPGRAGSPLAPGGAVGSPSGCGGRWSSWSAAAGPSVKRAWRCRRRRTVRPRRCRRWGRPGR